MLSNGRPGDQVGNHDIHTISKLSFHFDLDLEDLDIKV